MFWMRRGWPCTAPKMGWILWDSLGLSGTSVGSLTLKYSVGSVLSVSLSLSEAGASVSAFGGASPRQLQSVRAQTRKLTFWRGQPSPLNVDRLHGICHPQMYGPRGQPSLPDHACAPLAGQPSLLCDVLLQCAPTPEHKSIRARVIFVHKPLALARFASDLLDPPPRGQCPLHRSSWPLANLLSSWPLAGLCMLNLQRKQQEQEQEHKQEQEEEEEKEKR